MQHTCTPKWNPVSNPPDNSRVVVALVNDTPVEAFYWRAEGLWYRKHGSKRRSKAILPSVWSETRERLAVLKAAESEAGKCEQ